MIEADGIRCSQMESSIAHPLSPGQVQLKVARLADGRNYLYAVGEGGSEEGTCLKTAFSVTMLLRANGIE